MNVSTDKSGTPQLLLGVDIGGTKTALIVGTAQGDLVDRIQFDSLPARGYQAMLDDILAAATKMRRGFPQIAAIGASVGGPMDAEQGVVFSPPHLPGWDAVPLAKDLRALGLPVRIEHDAKAGALAEWRFGAGRGCSDLVFLTLGTGIGAGVVAGGRLLRGVGNAAGEIGHWRMRQTGPDFYGKPGALEGFASGGGIAAYARMRHPDKLGQLADARELGERVKRLEVEALEVVADAGEILGCAVSMLIDLLAPEKVILGSLAQRLGAALCEPMHAAIKRETLPSTLAQCTVVSGQLGDKLGDLAALSVAVEALQFNTK